MGKKTFNWPGLAAFPLTLFLIGYGGYTLANQAYVHFAYRAAAGRVTWYGTINQQADGTGGQRSVRFTYGVNGQIYEGRFPPDGAGQMARGMSAVWQQPLEPGDAVTVYHHPDRPQQCDLDNTVLACWWGMLSFGMAMGLLGWVWVTAHPMACNADGRPMGWGPAMFAGGSSAVTFLGLSAGLSMAPLLIGAAPGMPPWLGHVLGVAALAAVPVMFFWFKRRAQREKAAPAPMMDLLHPRF